MDTENKKRPFTPNEKEGVVGPIIGSVIIILLILLGALYYLRYIQEKRTNAELKRQQTQTLNQEDVEVIIREIIEQEQEIQSDNTEQEIEKELEQIDAELSELENL